MYLLKQTQNPAMLALPSYIPGQPAKLHSVTNQQTTSKTKDKN